MQLYLFESRIMRHFLHVVSTKLPPGKYICQHFSAVLIPAVYVCVLFVFWFQDGCKSGWVHVVSWRHCRRWRRAQRGSVRAGWKRPRKLLLFPGKDKAFLCCWPDASLQTSPSSCYFRVHYSNVCVDCVIIRCCRYVTIYLVCLWALVVNLWRHLIVFDGQYYRNKNRTYILHFCP